MKKSLLYLLFFIAVNSGMKAQEVKPIVTRGTLFLGDTIPSVQLREVEIVSLRIPKTRWERKRLNRLVYNVKKVYPFAKLAGIKLRQYDYLLVKAKTERERKRIMKKAEKEIKAEYGKPLENLTFSQGKILIKLIDRETGNSSYELVQELRGNFTAFFYQTFARLWGYNLKVRYDPKGKDRQIEAIVRMIESGRL